MLVKPLTDALARREQALYFDIDLPLVAVLAIVERTGAWRWIATAWPSWGDDAGRARRAARPHRGDGGEEFNLDSPSSSGTSCSRCWACARSRRTSAATPPTPPCSKSCRTTTRCRRSSRYRELAKIKSTYIDALPRMRADDGRVHIRASTRR